MSGEILKFNYLKFPSNKLLKNNSSAEMSGGIIL